MPIAEVYDLDGVVARCWRRRIDRFWTGEPIRRLDLYPGRERTSGHSKTRIAEIVHVAGLVHQSLKHFCIFKASPWICGVLINAIIQTVAGNDVAELLHESWERRWSRHCQGSAHQQGGLTFRTTIIRCEVGGVVYSSKLGNRLIGQHFVRVSMNVRIGRRCVLCRDTDAVVY